MAKSTRSQLRLIDSLSHVLHGSDEKNKDTGLAAPPLGWLVQRQAGRERQLPGSELSYCPLGPRGQESCTMERPHLAPAGLVMEEEEGKLCYRSSCRRGEGQCDLKLALQQPGERCLPSCSDGLQPPGFEMKGSLPSLNTL